jgi:hypothetical protein
MRLAMLLDKLDQMLNQAAQIQSLAASLLQLEPLTNLQVDFFVAINTNSEKLIAALTAGVDHEPDTQQTFREYYFECNTFVIGINGYCKAALSREKLQLSAPQRSLLSQILDHTQLISEWVGELRQAEALFGDE